MAKKSNIHLAIVIPVYNEEGVIKKVIEGLPTKLNGIGKITILAVNDGSLDLSIREIKMTRARLINLPINLGYGGASITGLEAAKKIKSDIAVTFDGDGQHSADDIQKIVDPIIAGKSDLVIGTRFSNSKNVPLLKRVGIKMMNVLTFFITGSYVSDSQCGLKAFSAKSLNKMNLELSGMEFASEIVLEAKRKRLKITEVPVRIIYTGYSIKKGQSVFNGINIMLKLIYKKITR
ncbi:MAG: Undecaprenyl-phosphate 4-deoxy-4-formamido-L-arabinose transferase [candidate division WS2 bacterium ADurb.Bin280]|uniref:Undecaprenyl-phosphate 4-deoxy-4-formamido-L-arabinose transferase n=1 Tax=candidate division WS2 bacterium ADurb.Bin280 TaxID=1852829 RepID=A0A1V5SBD6_9BACT|nr:MAG: Undecaprenyl-phosphate 4-deoxy-4-formamido-L-arabinose transferase [candidate division WS2 bacterium ADurb.Bin280]